MSEKINKNNETQQENFEIKLTQLKETNEKLIRSLASKDNEIKRKEIDMENSANYQIRSISEKFIKIINELKQANMHLKDKGLEMIIQNIKKTLSEYEIEEIETKIGTNFDHNIHEAISTKKSE